MSALIELKNIPAVSMNPLDITIRESCERARKDLGNLDELVESIIKNGQITPILITRDNELIAGERRLKACQSIPIPILAIYRDQVDDLTMREIELEENIQRKDMDWKEQAILTKQIQDLKQEKHGEKKAGRGQEGWSLADTAEAMGKSKASVLQDIKLAKAMEQIPELANAKTADDARKMLKKLEESVLIEELMKRQANKPQAYSFAENHYILGDALIALPKEPDSIMDYADVDTPYGIDLPNMKKSQVGTLDLKSIGAYKEWPKEKYIDICKYVATEVFRILKDNTFCTWWFGLEHYAALKDTLEKVGFQLDPIPAMWSAGSKAAQTNQPQTMFGKSYDTFFLLRKGKPILHKPGRHNVFDYPKVNSHDKIHPTEKPLDLYIDIIKTIIFPGSKAFVPFLGSANALRALYAHQCSGHGWDIPEHADIRNKFLLRVETDIEDGVYNGKVI